MLIIIISSSGYTTSSGASNNCPVKRDAVGEIGGTIEMFAGIGIHPSRPSWLVPDAIERGDGGLVNRL
jgi:hypothetical protein